MKLYKAITILVGVSLATSSFAVYKSNGWQWYKEKPLIDYSDVEKHYEKKDSDKEESKLSPTEQMNLFHKEYDNVMNNAYMHPDDKQAVAASMAYRKYTYTMSKKYGNTFKEVLAENPFLSNHLEQPTEQIATQIMREEQSKKEDEAIRRVVSKDYGIFWFYAGQDPMAQAQAKSLQNFADEFDISLIGISMDGIAIKDIKDNRRNKGQAEKFNVKAFPAIFLINPKTEKVHPVSYGFVSIDELKHKIYDVVTRYGKDKLDV
jgi:conjugal transfer pilus assembly protein TraF